ncbi:MAG: metal-dependent hydrolase [Hydrogenophilales bacterium CG03_land_8_20_14_0_80_62_28]|nr:ABC transporter permease [Betaproteobacteria bacterium]PIV24224.1 MAG: metal-dependent hydrolase [Hydrogenophilales bacterium CG03_land_8_20_14_0_80_62_28]PIW37602.1 MAG: metal-dependent hydrolase [Hydrogenophilales bacterium CG15_BIG_FIL_POST_REV_8_21_14_020_62_31]PIW71163.1 MAG: metal-dependent hydrolase [Hydrogenophilales bacterium CG12_big_fil_rev_8_21_14_0_65_61_21]PIX01611.1 MAG: metal-dependent hydrolase [Hydrogenophilales bacterium CG_4_8_14_3_um_filter_62_83]PIY99052.1 MAG: metal-d
MYGFRTLLYKEILRFWKVLLQTVMAPVLTALLYLLIFANVLGSHVQVYPGVSYTAFLMPGLVMMSILQNAFANGSSSLIQSKMNGNIVFVLLPPISNFEFFAAYLIASIVRGLVVGLGVLLVGLLFTELNLAHPLWVLAFGVLASAAFAAVGIVAGIWADKYDHLAGVQNFFIMPLTFLSGVFYSIHALPAFWQTVSHYNPVFFMIDGFRYGFHGVSDVDPWLSLAVVLPAALILSWIALQLIRSGYKLRS